jgi:hypothetical protein
MAEGASLFRPTAYGLLFPRSGQRRAPNKQKFFGSFFQKRTAVFLQQIALGKNALPGSAYVKSQDRISVF